MASGNNLTDAQIYRGVLELGAQYDFNRKANYLEVSISTWAVSASKNFSSSASLALLSAFNAK